MNRVRVFGSLSVAVVLWALVATGCASGFGDRIDNGLSVENRTEADLTIVYLASETSAQDGRIIDPEGITEIGEAPAEVTTLMTTPRPLTDFCTIAPLVARDADGSEVGRLDAGACVGEELITWTIA